MPIRSLRLLKSGLAMVVAARFVEAADNGAHDGMEASRHLHHAWTVNARAHAMHVVGLEVAKEVPLGCPNLIKNEFGGECQMAKYE